MRSRIASGLLAALFIAGCASVPLRDVVPEQLVSEAEMPGLSQVRIWGDAGATEISKIMASEMPAIVAKYKERIARKEPLQSNILAISGGADDGAFGAGLLAGWGETGTRPEFDLVTGISAGALVAPLVFLGADYDDELASVFTTHEADDIFEANILEGLFGGAAVANSGPLAKLIDKYVDAELVRRVAEESDKGRLLIIGTTNIDAQRPVYWDMGRIAKSNSPEAVETFRKVLLASASIPGVFPPVHFKVSAGGKTYEELHVDGGATRQLFFSPSEFSFKALDRMVGKKIDRRLYIIRNGKIGPEWKATKETTLALAQRSLETLTKSQGIGDLIRAYAKAKEDKIDFNLIAIPDSFTAPRPGPFNPVYMKPLYDTGYALGKAGIEWAKAPPGLGSEPKTAAGKATASAPATAVPAAAVPIPGKPEASPSVASAPR
jgi:predicted acylesterase/phospholipase RssA